MLNEMLAHAIVAERRAATEEWVAPRALESPSIRPRWRVTRWRLWATMSRQPTRGMIRP